MSDVDLITLWTRSGLLSATKSSGFPLPAMTMQNGTAINNTFDVNNIDDAACNEWNGYRQFSEADIEKLAIAIVNQVRKRGPFLSMSEFVNRRIGSDSDFTRMGALQNAIEDARLNENLFTGQRWVSESDVSNATTYAFKTPKAATGNPAAGAPGWLSQADILKVLEPAATVRSDTFVIRTCGEATDKSGNVIAKAYVEAVLQRVPDYINSSDPPSSKLLNPNSPNNANDSDAPFVLAPENLAFGRKFVVASFRWLSEKEI
jgi:hypothetical protein